MDIAAWLRSLGLEQYEAAFRDNAIDWEVLPKLTSEDLREIGVAAIGHRRKLLDALATIGAEAPTATSGDTWGRRDAERRQLTVMFCDLVGSTALSTRFDPEDLRTLIGHYQDTVVNTVNRFDGFVAKYMGDGVLVYFGYPLAHEDDAERAVRAGLAVVEAVGQLPAQQNLSVRLGIATGLAVVGDLIGEGAAQERGVVGETPNLAARLQALAAPDTLVIAETTRRQVGGLFALVDLGPQALAGFAELQPAWRVLGESGVASRFEALRSGTTPLVGRGEELDMLLRRWQQAKTGQGRVVLLTGEPGIGKSRLTAALSERLATESHTRLRYFCSLHHQDSALYPVIVQLERAAGFERNDGPAAKLDKLVALLGAAAKISDISLLAELISLPGGAGFPPLNLNPQHKKECTFAALLQQLEGLTRQDPVLMIFEDLHWIDPTSRDLFDLILGRIDRLPVLLIATFRPEFQPPWAGQPHVTVIALNRLGQHDGAAMVQQVADDAALLPQDMIAEIVERTDGVPLFVEEMTKAVLEAGAQRGPEIAASVPLTRVGVPATLQASLMARLDRLGLAAKSVAQIGATIGRSFTYELITAVAGLSDAPLRQLVGSGLVLQRGTPPHSSYMFKHALIQDAAYQSLLRSRRHEIHASIAGLLERDLDIVNAQSALLGHHCAEAGLSAKAAHYYTRAGQWSASRSALIEARAHFASALALLAKLAETPDRDQQELETQTALGSVLLALNGYAGTETGHAFSRAAELWERLGRPSRFLRVVWGQFMFHGNRSEIAIGRQIASDLLRLSREGEDSNGLVLGHMCVGCALMLVGDLVGCRTHFEQVLSLFDPLVHAELGELGIHPVAMAQSFLGLVLSWLGYPDQAVAVGEASIAAARKANHIPSLLSVMAVYARSLTLIPDRPRLSIILNELMKLCDEHRLPFWVAQSMIHGGWLAAQQGDIETGVASVRRGFVAFTETGASAWTELYRALLADILKERGELAEASNLIDDAIDFAERTGQLCLIAEVYRRKGELQLDKPMAAEQYLRQAIQIAQTQSARLFELRSTISLAQLLAQQGRRVEAGGLLAPIYEWFTEGYETPDLKKARALLLEFE
jgi:class 3 adenylate cyclase/predicted ATPase